MARKRESRTDRHGTITHYDQHGRKTGRSEPNRSGGYNHYDSKGRKTGQSRRTSSGSYNHYDSKGRYTGRSDRSISGGYTHTGSFGDQPKPTKTHRDLLHYKLLHPARSGNSQGCYIATCVYGSYDCPQVWTLRRFRDNTLAGTRRGRCFIHAYYAISPVLVAWFGRTRWFQRIWRGVLDRFVAHLQHNGVEAAPYEDRR